MTLGSPEWLWALIGLPFLLVLFLWNEKRSTELIRRVVAPRLVPQLAGNVSYFRRRLRYGLMLLGYSLLVTALARPQIGYTYEEAMRKGRDVIIAVDTSRSMLANDLRPNRLTRAKMAAQDLITNLSGDRVGLIAFAGTAFLQAPLTIDYSAVLNALQELDTEIIPRGGTNIAQAIDMAIEAFGKGESDSRALIILTDGEELDSDAMKFAEKYADQLTIFTVGVGSEDGSIIPIPKEGGGTDFVRDAADEVVRSRLDEKRLKDIADTSGGFYQRLDNSPVDMKRIIDEGLGTLTEQQIDARMARRPIERYRWPLGAGLTLLALSILIADRKCQRHNSLPGSTLQRAVVASAFLVLAHTLPSFADGVRLYHKNDYRGAYNYFQKLLKRQPDSAPLHFDSGAAAYKLGNYDEALQAFSRALTSADEQLQASAEYNLGNTLFQRGASRENKEKKIEEWKSALEHYEQSLAMNSENEDARYNRDLVKKLIDDLEKEQQKEQESENQKNQDQQQREDRSHSMEEKGQDEKGDRDQNRDGKQGAQEDEQGTSGPQDKDDSGEEGKQKKESGKSNEGDNDKDSNPENSSGEQNARPQPNDQENEAPQHQPEQQQRKELKPQSPNSPVPVPSPGDQDLSGEIRANDNQTETRDGRSQEMPVAIPAEDGKMNEQQAAALLRSLQNEDAQVPLLQRPQNMPVLKDW